MRRSFTALVTAAALSATTVGLTATANPAYAATISSASLSGSSGTHTTGGTLYVRGGSSLTLSVTTSNAKCVVASNSNGTEFDSDSDNQTKTSWLLSGSGLSGDGTKTIDAVAYDKKNCTDGGSSASVFYYAANTLPTLSVQSVAPATGTPAAHNGWYRGDVVVNWSCASVPSALGLKSTANCSEASTVTGEGANLGTSKTVEDNVGNSKTTPVTGIKIDRTPPTTSLNAEPADWSAEDVMLTLVAGTDLSGIASTHYTIDEGDVQDGTSVLVEGEGVHEVSFWSVDVAGNVEVAKSTTVKIDATDPTIESSQNPVKNVAAWNNTGVDVSFTCADEGGSGLASCVGHGRLDAEGAGQVVAGTATDNAGRTTSLDHTVNIDMTNPNISAEVNDDSVVAAWYTGDVFVSFTCDDESGEAHSGIDDCTEMVEVEDEGANQRVYGDATDFAGNGGPTFVTVSVDRSPPTTSSDAPAAWSQDAVTVTLDGEDQDGLSGLDYTEYRIDGGPWTEGASVTFEEDGEYSLAFRSVDVAGNKEDVQEATIQIDGAAPDVADAGPTEVANGDNGWYKTAVTNTFTASDLLSGLADEGKASFTKSSGTSEGVAVTIASGAVGDVAGNSNPGIDSVAFKIDLTPPTRPTFTGITDGASYESGQVPSPSSIGCSTTETGSGLVSACAVAGYDATVGTHTLTASTKDNAGHVSTNTLDLHGHCRGGGGSLGARWVPQPHREEQHHPPATG